MTAPLVQRLQLVVDATTGQSEARLESLGRTARDAGQSTDRAASTVADAANRVSAAQLKQADAAKAVEVAQLRLDELRSRGNASASQLAAAEGRVESAQRRLHVATRELATAQDDQDRTQRRAADGAEDAARSSGRLSQGMDELRANAVGFIAGGALVAYLRETALGFVNGARDAGSMARSMNATVEQAGQLGVLLGNVGVESGDLLEIQAQFAGVVGANNRVLSEFGAEVMQNADGTTNWALTLESALIQLQQIPDATERNRRLFQLFGEEGGKQMAALLTSGVDLRDALESIGTPFTPEDVAAAAEFDRAMAQLSLTAGGVGRDLGAALIPAATAVASGLGDVVDVATSVPAPIAAATAAAILLGRTGWDPLAAGGSRVALATDLASGALARFRFVAGTAGIGAAAATAGAVGLAAGMRGVAALTGALGGPLGLALIGGAVAFSQASEGSDELAESAREAARDLAGLEAAQGGTRVGVLSTARALQEEAGYWERSAAYVRGYQADREGLDLALAKGVGWFQRLTMGASDTADTTQGFALAVQDAREELGEFGAQQAVAQQTSAGLNELIAAGTTGGQEFADAARAAAEAQNTQAHTTGLAEAAIAAYNAVNRDAVAATRERIDAIYAAEDANFGFLAAMDAANAATDDGTTSVNEQRQAQVQLMTAALQAADAAADAAVESREAAGQVLTDVDRANVRAGAMIEDLRSKLATPGLSAPARAEMQALIDQLVTAQERGDIRAILTLTGAEEAQGELDETAEDRDTSVRVESRNGPAVDRYLDDVAGGDRRLSLIRVESRNGPAVDDYLWRITNANRLALIHVESRGGPAVDSYLDGIASARRVAVIDVQRRDAGPTGGARGPGAAGLVGAGSVSIGQLIVQPQVDAGGRLSAGAMRLTGEQVVGAVREYERRNGPGWRRS